MRRRPVRRWLATGTAGGLGGIVLILAMLAVPSPSPAAAATPTGTRPTPTKVVAGGLNVDAPVYDADAPDPDVIRVGSTYYAYTTGSDLRNIQVLESSDLQSWTLVGDALPVLASWSTFGQTWRPGVVALGGQYVMYYATEVAATGEECISLATSAVPAGPFTDTSSGPLVCQTNLGGSIDPHPFVDGDGTPYLYWKSNGGQMPIPADIWVAQLAPDGLALVASPVKVLTQDQAWESTVESPVMVEESGAYVLFYSGGLWNSPGYGVAYADCNGPLGPCTKPDDAPILHSDRYRLGPGGESLVQDADGNWWMAYHAWDGPASYCSYAQGEFRSLWVAPVTFTGGTPTIDAGEAPEGYRLIAGDGGVFSFGAATFEGSMGRRFLASPVVGGAADDATGGYWEVGADGGVFAFGEAPYFGSMGGRLLAAPIVGMAVTPDGGGYWLVASDGGVFAFGDAPYSGSMGGRHLAAPIVAMAAMPQGGGYWLVGSDGGVFAFGEAPYFGSMGGRLQAAPIVAVAAGPGSGGYWLLTAGGGMFSFGDAQFLGSMGGQHLADGVVGDTAG